MSIAIATGIIKSKRIIMVGVSDKEINNGIYANKILQCIILETKGKGGGNSGFAQGVIPIDVSIKEIENGIRKYKK